MVTSLLDWIKVIIRPMKHVNGKRTFKLGLIITMSCHPWDSNVKVTSYFSSLTHFSSHNHTNCFSLTIEQNPPNSPQQDTPVPGMPHKKALREPTPGPSGPQWSEDLFCKPSQHGEPPIPSLAQSSEPQVTSHENASACEPEPEVALAQSTEAPFACPATPHSVIIIDNMPISSPPNPSPESPPIAQVLPSFP
ncbi:hypothetical protein O181_066563 [Austropuccinia psidii MF-1]|uniref:Uncharacterized protein n=1 Tax=Austropuccinia psidii MF-1 TaxID=1389203 RepID=A0A9Q3ERP0_9BASI|nr:hypothetical protein [Austropuccinia psidii MF-1]